MKSVLKKRRERFVSFVGSKKILQVFYLDTFKTFKNKRVMDKSYTLIPSASGQEFNLPVQCVYKCLFKNPDSYRVYELLRFSCA